MMRWMSVLSWGRSLPRDLRLLFFSLFLWTFGLGVYNYVWSLYLTQLNANPEQVGLVYSIGFFAAAVSMIPGGILANRYDNRTLLIIGWAMSIPVPIMFYFSIKRRPPREVDSRAPLFEVPRSRQELTILVFLFGATTAISITSPSFLPLFLKDQLHLTDAQIQLLGAVQAIGSAIFVILLGRWAANRDPGSTMAKELLLVAGGALGIIFAGSPMLVVPMVFLLGGARAPSFISYSLLSNMRQGRSRAGQWGFYLTFEQFGFVAGSFIGGFLYATNHTSVLLTTALLFVALAALAGFGIRRPPALSQTAPMNGA